MLLRESLLEHLSRARVTESFLAHDRARVSLPLAHVLWLPFDYRLIAHKKAPRFPFQDPIPLPGHRDVASTSRPLVQARAWSGPRAQMLWRMLVPKCTSVTLNCVLPTRRALRLELLIRQRMATLEAYGITLIKTRFVVRLAAFVGTRGPPCHLVTKALAAHPPQSASR